MRRGSRWTSAAAGEERGPGADRSRGARLALERLAAISERQAKVVELRYFGGLEIEEIADVLDISPATVKRDWTVARAFLKRELADGPQPADGNHHERVGP